MKRFTFARTSIGMTVGALLLAACGGGSGSSDTGSGMTQNVNGTDVPVSATTSSAAAVAFVASVAATSDNTAEPIRVGDAILATSDSDEPDSGV